MLAGLLISLAGPAYLVFFSGLEMDRSRIWTAVLAIAGTLAVLWVVEPLTYYPILGQASMHQAFMIGNISHKLLPPALMAQAAIGALAGTRKGELAALMAIGGAVMVQRVSLLVFVGLLGTWLVSVVSADVVALVPTYILPTVTGAILVQAIASQKQPKTTIIAGVVAAVAVLAWSLRDRSADPERPSADEQSDEATADPTT